MFWRRQQSGMTTTSPQMETADTGQTESTSVSEQPIGTARPAETTSGPDEMAIFDAVHAPAATEGGATVATETGAVETTSAVAATPATAETVPEIAPDTGFAKTRKAEPAEKAEKAGGGAGAFGFGLLLGAALGAAAALLFAPKSGEEMRSELVETGRGLKGQAGGAASSEDWRPTASPWAGQAADVVQAAATSAETTLRQGETDAQQAASDFKDDTEDRIQKF